MVAYQYINFSFDSDNLTIIFPNKNQNYKIKCVKKNYYIKMEQQINSNQGSNKNELLLRNFDGIMMTS